MVSSILAGLTSRRQAATVSLQSKHGVTISCLHFPTSQHPELMATTYLSLEVDRNEGEIQGRKVPPWTALTCTGTGPNLTGGKAVPVTQEGLRGRLPSIRLLDPT